MDGVRYNRVARSVLWLFRDYETRAPHVWSPVWLAVVVASSVVLLVVIFDMGRASESWYLGKDLSSVPVLTWFVLSWWFKMLVVLLPLAGTAKELAVKNKAGTLIANKLLLAIVGVLAALFVFGVVSPLVGGVMWSVVAPGNGQP